MAPRKVEIKDYLDLEFKSLITDARSLLSDMESAKRKPILKASIDATHSGRLTNLRVYPGKFMKDSAKTFLEPTPRPLLRYHNEDGDAIGRVTNATYVQLKNGYDFDNDFLNPGTGLGSGFIRLDVNVLDPKAIEKFIDGRYKSVSTRQHSAYMLCSICGDNMADYSSECEHIPGKEYDVEGSDTKYKCYGITGPLEYREVSVVNIPGDSQAAVKEITLDNENEYSMSCLDSSMANVESLVLSDGENEVHLMASAIKTRVTAEDKKKLTGKTVIAVSPNFDPSMIKSLANEDKGMKEKEVEDKTKNTDTAAASGGTQKPAQADTADKSKEGVVAPETSADKTKGAGDEGKLSDAALSASIEALTKSLTDAKALADSAKAEVERLKGSLKEKDDEITRIRDSETKSITDLKKSYATTLLTSQMFLKKTQVATIKDAEAFNAKLAEYCGRSVDSLKDSIADLATELSAYQESNGIKPIKNVVADKKLESPVSDTSPEKADEKDAEKSKSDEEVIQDFLNVV